MAIRSLFNTERTENGAFDHLSPFSPSEYWNLVKSIGRWIPTGSKSYCVYVFVSYRLFWLWQRWCGIGEHRHRYLLRGNWSVCERHRAERHLIKRIHWIWLEMCALTREAAQLSDISNCRLMVTNGRATNTCTISPVVRAKGALELPIDGHRCDDGINRKNKRRRASWKCYQPPRRPFRPMSPHNR